MIPPSVPRCVKEHPSVPTFAGTVKVSFRQLGELVLPTGRLRVADVDAIDESKPLAHRLEIGSVLRVVATLAAYPDRDQRIAAVRLVLDAKHAPVKWSEARPLIHSTDSGLSCYLDEDAADHISRLKDLPRQRLFTSLHKSFDENYADTRTWGSVRVSQDTQANLVAFSAGFGDGEYGTYLGHDRDGRLVTILTDFGLLLTQAEIDAMDDLDL
jgi:hypothetical protein